MQCSQHRKNISVNTWKIEHSKITFFILNYAFCLLVEAEIEIKIPLTAHVLSTILKKYKN